MTTMTTTTRHNNDSNNHCCNDIRNHHHYHTAPHHCIKDNGERQRRETTRMCQVTLLYSSLQHIPITPTLPSSSALFSFPFFPSLTISPAPAARSRIRMGHPHLYTVVMLPPGGFQFPLVDGCFSLNCPFESPKFSMLLLFNVGCGIETLRTFSSVNQLLANHIGWIDVRFN